MICGVRMLKNSISTAAKITKAIATAALRFAFGFSFVFFSHFSSAVRRIGTRMNAIANPQINGDKVLHNFPKNDATLSHL